MKVRDMAWCTFQVTKYQKADPNRKKASLPKKPKPSPQCGTQMYGIANNMGNFKFEDYVPDYDKPNAPRLSAMSLEERCQMMQNMLRGYFVQHGK